jgi:CRP/FNR family transcriptional regulator, cyclic AMP receptor protein
LATKRRPFDPKSFLAKVGEGRTIAKYRKGQVVFAQGDPADAVFYIQKGKVKITVVSDRGKEAVIASDRTSSAARGAWPGSRGAWQPSRR